MPTAIPKYIDRRRHNGGARFNAGRPLSSQWKAMDKFLDQTIVVKQFRHGQDRRVNTTVFANLLDHTIKDGFTKGNRRKMKWVLGLADGEFFKRARIKKRPLTREEKFERMLATEERKDTIRKRKLDADARESLAAIHQSYEAYKAMVKATNMAKLAIEEKREQLDRLRREQQERYNKTHQEWLDERAKIERDGYFIDPKTGRKVLTEKAARRANAAGLGKYLSNKEKLEKYRRGERPRIEE